MLVAAKNISQKKNDFALKRQGFHRLQLFDAPSRRKKKRKE